MLSAFTFTAMGADKGKWETIEFKADGICEMCKDRIENALKIKGVKYASWNMETKTVKVIYRPDKVSEEELHQAVANAGHDTAKIKASDEAYKNKVHACCKYREMDSH